MNPTTMIVASPTGGRVRRLVARLSRWRGGRRVLTGHQHSVHFVGFDSSGEWALSGSVDDTVKLWEFGTGRLFRSIGGSEELLEVIEMLGIDLPRFGLSRVQQVFAGHGYPGLMTAVSPVRHPRGNRRA